MTRAMMARWRAYPVFFVSLAVLGLAGAAGAADAWQQARRLGRAEALRAQRRLELLAPQTRPEMVAAAAEEAARAQEQLRRARASWPGFAAADGPLPDRLGAYAALAAFVERSRAAAKAAEVAIAKDECFGFARHQHEAPAAGEVATVSAQLEAVERVLAALLAASPSRLLAVWREDPQSVGCTPVRAGAEWCSLDLVRSVRVPELAQTRVVRVAFVGTTGVLRAFLNGLARAPALVVREVMVAKPDERGEATRGREPGCRRFTVTLEAVAIAGGIGGTVGTEATAPPIWVEPAGPVGGRFEVFAPASLEFDPGQRSWREASPVAVPEGGWGVELREVRRVPYRWRLVGHVGDGADCGAVLEDRATRRSVVLRPGGREPDTGLVLTALEFPRAADGGRGLRATLADPGVREPVVLTPSGGDGPVHWTAVLQVPGKVAPVEVAEGATVAITGAHLTIGRIDAAGVEVTRAATAGQPAERRRLRAVVK